MRTSENPLLPSIYEYWYSVMAAMAILVAGNAKVLLEHFGLMSSSNIVGNHVSATVGGSLRVIDNLSATPGVVTFITWGIIGLVVFSIIHAFTKASSALDFERELGSNRFVHPANFNPRRYWHTILLNAFLSFGLIAMLAASIVLYVLFVVPIASLYLQRCLIVSSIGRFVDLAISLFIVSTGTLALYFVLRAVLWQHRHSQQ